MKEICIKGNRVDPFSSYEENIDKALRWNESSIEWTTENGEYLMHRDNQITTIHGSFSLVLNPVRARVVLLLAI